MEIKIHGDIILKPIEKLFAKDIWNTIDSEREYLREWLNFIDYSKTYEDTESFVSSVIDDESPKQFCIYDGDVFIGMIGFNHIDMLSERGEIGYWISKKAQKRGVVTCSVINLLDYGFNTLKFHRIQLNAAKDNTKSRKIAEKLGFDFESYQRDGVKLSDMGFSDYAIYSMLKPEYEKLDFSKYK